MEGLARLLSTANALQRRRGGTTRGGLRARDEPAIVTALVRVVTRMMRWLPALVVVTAGCGPPCRAVSAPATFVYCPAPRADVSFVCSATASDGRNETLMGRCLVTVRDGGIDFFVEGEACDRLPLPAPVSGVRCEVPPLSPGPWVIAGVLRELPADGGVAAPRP